MIAFPFQNPTAPSLWKTPRATSNIVSWRLCSTISSLIRSRGAMVVLDTTADRAPHSRCFDHPAAVWSFAGASLLKFVPCALLSCLLLVEPCSKLAKHGWEDLHWRGRLCIVALSPLHVLKTAKACRLEQGNCAGSKVHGNFGIELPCNEHPCISNTRTPCLLLCCLQVGLSIRMGQDA